MQLVAVKVESRSGRTSKAPLSEKFMLTDSPPRAVGDRESATRSSSSCSEHPVRASPRRRLARIGSRPPLSEQGAQHDGGEPCGADCFEHLRQDFQYHRRAGGGAGRIPVMDQQDVAGPQVG